MNRAEPDLITPLIEALTPMSETTRRLLEVLQDEARSSADLVKIVECDAPLTVRVLRVVNSSMFGLATRVESVDRAVTHIGERAIITSALLEGSGALFEEPLEGYGSPDRGLWESGLRTAVAARRIANRASPGPAPSLAYTGGLLRDIGKSILSELLKGRTDAAIAAVESGRAADFCDAEREITGFDHCELGARIADHFELSPALRAAIAHHHRPIGASEEDWHLVSTVHVADCVARTIGGEGAVDDSGYGLESRCLDALDLSAGDLDEIIAETTEEYERTLQAFAETSG